MSLATEIGEELEEVEEVEAGGLSEGDGSVENGGENGGAEFVDQRHAVPAPPPRALLLPLPMLIGKHSDAVAMTRRRGNIAAAARRIVELVKLGQEKAKSFSFLLVVCC